MKFEVPLLIVMAASLADSFQNHRLAIGSHRTSKIHREASAEEADTVSQTVTKEDLLGARDAIDKLLREKACGGCIRVMSHVARYCLPDWQF
jgi:hypothetical protein